jgi:hypothetical protein
MLKKHIFVFAVMAAVLLVAFSSCDLASSGSGNGGSGTSSAEPNWGVQTKTTDCVIQGAFQDTACTPGAILSVTKEQVCVSGYARSVRNVPQSVKNKVFAEYGITKHPTGAYEVDHLVSLELGGSNDIANLWPEAATPKPGFHEKDQVENYLHNQVCNGNITLKQAQIEIATNWLNVYHHMS